MNLSVNYDIILYNIFLWKMQCVLFNVEMKSRTIFYSKVYFQISSEYIKAKSPTSFPEIAWSELRGEKSDF